MDKPRLTSDDEILLASSRRRPSLVADVIAFVVVTKKWWLLPVLVCVLAFGLMASLAGSPAAPFIYTLF